MSLALMASIISRFATMRTLKKHKPRIRGARCSFHEHYYLELSPRWCERVVGLLVLRHGSGTGSRRRPAGEDHDARADLNALVEVRDVFVGQTDAARGHERTDGRGLIGTVNSIQGLAEVKRARAERIAVAAGHEARQVGLAFDHSGRWIPVRP